MACAMLTAPRGPRCWTEKAMRQIWIPKFGDANVLRLERADDPEPGPGELRIRVAYSGVNFADLMGRMGLYPDLPPIPCVPGYEVSGEVDAVGAGVDEAWIGTEAIALTRFGGYADVVCVPQGQVTQRPAGLSMKQAAALPVNYLTAYTLVTVMGGLRADETVLVHSAGGGVGIAVAQLAKHIGAQVIGTASAHKHPFLLELGVDHVIDYRTEDFETRVLVLTENRGVELVLDAVGGANLQKSFRVLATTGRLGMFGISSAASGRKRSMWRTVRALLGFPWVQANPLTLMSENKGVFGVNIGHMWNEQERVAGWMQRLAELADEGVVAPHVDETFPFEHVAAAHRHIESRRNIGKVLLAA